MDQKALIFWALAGVRAEREAAWREYLAARRAGDDRAADRMAAIYTQLDQAEKEIARMEAHDAG